MKMDATGNISATQEEFVISRMFNAPRKQVWSAWTEREQLMRWFGPQGYTISHAALDLHVGGIFHYAMRAQTEARCGASGRSARSHPRKNWC